jgi:type II secretory pathway component PulF
MGEGSFCLAILLLCLTAIWLRQLLWPDYRQMHFIEWWRQRLFYYTPLIGHIYRPGQWADVTTSLARGVADGRTWPDVLQTAQSGGVECVVEEKLCHWQRLLARGMELRPAAEAAKLPRLLCAALVPGGAQILADGLNYVAAVYAQRYRRRLEIFRGAIIPASVVCFGLVVGLLVVSLWQMYVALIILVEHQGPY